MTSRFEARTRGILSEEIGDELVLYDNEAHVAHALTGAAATVWRACQPGRTLSELVAETDFSVDVLSGGLAELEAADLIRCPATISRRGVLAGAAAVGLTVPLVLSVPIAGATSIHSSTTVTATSLTPTEGPAAGGTLVTVTGTNFAAGATVVVDGETYPANVVNSTSLTFTTPAHTAESVTVAVTSGGMTSADVPGGFTYVS